MNIVNALKFLHQALIKGDEYARFSLAERISNKIYNRYKFSEFGRTFLYDKAFLQYYQRFENTGNFHSLDRKYALDQLMKLTFSLEGETAECGVYKGASSYLICRNIAGRNKSHHIFDSFEGLSRPGAEDGDYWKKGDLACAEADIRENLKAFDFVRYYKGWIPDRFSEVVELRFCFVHLDIDLYQPTLDSLAFFYPRMVPRGVLLCDDYGFINCPGAQKAMNIYFSDKTEQIVSLPTGQGFVIKEG
ncbi:MAG: TylF/MycF/NovP-related O-methyltransferase [Nitrospiria bacterium]